MARRKIRMKLRFNNPVLVSIPQFARLSGLGESMIRQLLAEGELPVRKIGNRCWIIRDAAEAWLRKQVA
jgi:excisionase family DNA binding protein